VAISLLPSEVNMKTLVPAVLSVAVATSAHAQSITNLGVGAPDHDLSRAVGVSADGRFVTGISAGSSSSSRAYRWTAEGGFQFFGASNSTTPYGISGDGSTVVGQGDSYPTSGGAFQWSSGAIQIIGGSGWFATAANSDASVIVGAGGSYGRYAVRWVNGTQQYLGSLSSGASSTAWAVSSDGLTIAGEAATSFGGGQVAFRWRSVGGMESIGTLSGGNASSATGISGDGSVIVGASTATEGLRAFRWTVGGGMESLGVMAAGSYSSATAISADGRVVVGFGGLTDGTQSAFIHHGSFGMMNLMDYLTNSGVNMSGWDVLSKATGVSADGRYVVGNGIFNGAERAFIADIGVIPAPSAAPLLALAGLTARGRRRK
jgi:probable HAF family extracellular repeat protein